MMRVLNMFWLVLVLGMFPWVASRSLGGWQVASRSSWETLTLSAIGLAAALNAFIWLRARRRSLRRACLKWCVVFIAVGVVEALFFSGTFHFRWLQ